MQVVKPSWEILNFSVLPEDVLKFLERAARTCYKSQDKITEDSSKRIIKLILQSKHESVIEHASATIRFVANRGFTHELVRHRLASYSQESTRYVNYGKKDGGITAIDPCCVYGWSPDSDEYDVWYTAMDNAEDAYLGLLERGIKPQQARGVLPIDVRTEIVCTANLREWRLIFKLRCARDAHPIMQYLMIPLMQEFSSKIPLLFDNLIEE